MDDRTTSTNFPSAGYSAHKDSNKAQSEARIFGQNRRRLLKLVTKAFLNPCESYHLYYKIIFNYFLVVYLTWDAEEYYLKCVKSGGDKKRIKFPNPDYGSFSEPLTVVDVKGRILLWYLPDLLSVKEQVCIFQPSKQMNQ